MAKQWYTIQLEQQNYIEVVAKVKSKGLAFIVLNEMKKVYINIDYKVVMK